MLKKLENFYRRVGILSTEFRCKHSAECRGDLPITPQDASVVFGTFTQARSAFVGEHYGKTKLPRLAFVSSDPGTVKKTNDAPIHFAADEYRTPEGVRCLLTKRIRHIQRGEMNESKHSKGMNEFAVCVFDECADFGGAAFAEQMTNAQQRGAAFAAELAQNYYAHTNSAKCCRNQKQRKQSDVLLRKCQEYLRGELDVLQPDVIVSHGKPAKESAAKAFALSSESVAMGEFAKSGEEILWLPLPHPAERKGEYARVRKESGNWEKFAKQIRKFMQEQKQG